MKQFALYGELDNSPISMKSNKISDIAKTIQQLHKHTTTISWYFLYKVNKHGYEEMTKKAIINGNTYLIK